MDYYYPMEMEEEVHERPRFRRSVYPWQWHQWHLLGLLSSSSPSPAAAAVAQRSNHVSWEETAAAHLYSASLPGVRKEEIRVEVEDAMYLVIRTELDAGDGDGDDGGVGRRSFARKFRLPAMVDADGISAEYTHDVLRVTVPRLHTRARPVVNLAAGGPACDPVARAA